MKIITSIILFLSFGGAAFATDDWTYELSQEAIKIYENKSIQIPCDRIPALLIQNTQNSSYDLYYAIRDTGLFQTRSCGPIIQKHLNELK